MHVVTARHAVFSREAKPVGDVAIDRYILLEALFYGIGSCDCLGLAGLKSLCRGGRLEFLMGINASVWRQTFFFWETSGFEVSADLVGKPQVLL